MNGFIMADFDTITTAALSQLVDVPEGTLKSWKNRGKFTDGVHFSGRDWLPAAVDRCRELATAKDAPPATDSVATDATPTVADFAIEWGEQEIALADRIADLQIRREFGHLVESRLPIRLQVFRESVAADPSPYLDPLYLVGAGPRALGGAA